MIKEDGPGHKYIDVENIRLTYIPQSDRTKEKNWAKQDVIRIQAYKELGKKSLHPGAEIPISKPIVLLDLINGLCDLYKAVK